MGNAIVVSLLLIQYVKNTLPEEGPYNCICQLHTNIHGLIYVFFGAGTHDLHNTCEGGPSEGS